MIMNTLIPDTKPYIDWVLKLEDDLELKKRVDIWRNKHPASSMADAYLAFEEQRVGEHQTRLL